MYLDSGITDLDSLLFDRNKSALLASYLAVRLPERFRLADRVFAGHRAGVERAGLQ